MCALAVVAACSGDTDPKSDPTKPTSSSATPIDLTFGVYGEPDEVAAYQEVADAYNAEHPEVTVKIEATRSEAESMTAVETGAAPDIYLANSRNLHKLQTEELTQPVDELLDERGVDFGDGYQRGALLAFSGNNALQCMPYAISPMVIYYNTDLINFQAMRNRDIDAPSEHSTWTLAQFAAAAQWATQPKKKARGVHIDPTLDGLAPFVYSGGGTVFDDDLEPTATSFSSDGSRGALEETLEVLRNPHVTLTDKQLQRRSAVEWFEAGRLGMIAGYRDLVPELRKAKGLNFDVMAMPVLDDKTTVGDVTGICLSAETDHDAAADFLVHLLSVESVTTVAEAGYIVPANLEVAVSDAFIQPSLLPAHGSTFNATIRHIIPPPMVPDWTAVDEAVAQGLQELMDVPVLDAEEITTTTEEIDEASRAILSPEDESESPSD
ncbi:extracellular solute-binding protein [Nocardioides speluncae]|uniref:extracellular solute-binding protein n=1 Tax=Nocardioides speluncae TaxID=2670337 RepID=UPI00137AE7D7|nr:extracellular solute-binding protein [Nocardioides speluncae]